MAPLFACGLLLLSLLQKEVQSTKHNKTVTAHSTNGNGYFMYFAYASNLLKERLRLNSPSAVFNSTGKIKGYALKFGLWGELMENETAWQGGVATIKEQKDSEVWGVVWKISSEDRRNLDKQEGVDRGLYRPLEVNVNTTYGEILCHAYQMNNFTSKLASPQYKQVICMGAEQNGLPPDYIRELHALETNNNNSTSMLNTIFAAKHREKIPSHVGQP
ncbi:gamma-glutamylcyclotransferase-like [Paramormyrops kingsleyae]|uniref:Gamma-glutamylcyclotransferase b n=1 Tax=Paramormyrops kingsleyae TaxID=1676925 RepID=A0A3B3RI85_9TELE|nr:gamma-glutamylcyclotransferase-like [Paramormyrops kingsleyae]